MPIWRRVVTLVAVVSSASAARADPSDLNSLREAARAAARRGDCGEAALKVDEAAAIDAAYAERVLAHDPVITGCRDEPLTRPPTELDRMFEPAPPRPPRSTERSDDRTWYGGPMLFSDGMTALGLGVVAAFDAGHASATGAKTLPGWAGVAAFVLTAPIVHARHGHPRRAAGSVALRVLLPGGLGALAVASAMASPGRDSHAVYALPVIGALVAAVIDQFIAFDR